MTEAEDILISLDSRHAQNIYAGRKRVELRRRTMHIKAGDIIWIYEKIPVGSITGSACVSAVHVAAPSQLWRDFGTVSGLSQKEFFSYFEGLETACALVLMEAQALLHPISLSTLRKASGNFHPPQFFLRLQTKSRLLSALKTARAESQRESSPQGTLVIA